jgi:hypothetical protein
MYVYVCIDIYVKIKFLNFYVVVCLFDIYFSSQILNIIWFYIGIYHSQHIPWASVHI